MDIQAGQSGFHVTGPAIVFASDTVSVPEVNTSGRSYVPDQINMGSRLNIENVHRVNAVRV